jgi:hypothetical protein
MESRGIQWEELMAAVKLIAIDDDVIAASQTSIACLESQIGFAVTRAPAELDRDLRL